LLQVSTADSNNPIEASGSSHSRQRWERRHPVCNEREARTTLLRENVLGLHPHANAGSADILSAMNPKREQPSSQDNVRG